jgi:hypothetical protein
MSAWAILLVGGLSALPAPGWTAAGSPRFEMLVHAERDQARALLAHLEQAAEVLEARGAGSLTGRKLRLLVFATPAEYEPHRYTPYAAAHFSLTDAGAVIVASRPDPHLLTHELVHAMMPRTRPVPMWWEEGLAEYYSTMRFVRGKVVLGETMTSRIEALRKDLLTSLGALRRGAPSMTEALDFYRGSWAMAHVMLSAGLTAPPSEERWPFIYLEAVDCARTQHWPVRKFPAPPIESYSSLQTPRLISVSAAITPNAFQAGSWATLCNSGQALRVLPSVK